MSESFRVRIAKAEHVFSAAHFITIGGQCERLHGHNYHVAAEFAGLLDQNELVIDFLLVRAKLREIVTRLDHYVLLPTQSTRVAVSEQGDTVHVSVDGAPRYVFPRKDCALLPIPNTTVEMLAQMLATRLKKELDAAGARGLTAIEMEVEENFGQSAVYREALNAPS